MKGQIIWNTRRQKKFKKSKGRFVLQGARKKTFHYDRGCCQSKIINTEKVLNVLSATVIQITNAR